MVPADFSHGEPSLNRKQRRADKTQSASGETALLAVALRHHQSGRLTEAEDLYRRILRHDPGHAQALHLSGLLAHQSGRTGQAIALIEQAIRRDPRVPDFHGNLGNALRSAGRLAESETAFRHALRLRPDFAESHNNLGIALREQDRPAEAGLAYRRALILRPDYGEAHNNLGALVQSGGQLGAAATAYRRALTLRPNFAKAHSNLGVALAEQGEPAAAELAYRRALQFAPDHAETFSHLGIALKTQGRLPEAARLGRHAVALRPDFAEAYGNLGLILQEQALLASALACYDRALVLAPVLADIASNRLFCLAHRDGVGAALLFGAHLDFAVRFETPRLAAWPAHRPGGDPERPLRIGFVSGDLRAHAVAHFIEPVLALLAGLQTLSLTAYYNYPSEDPVTARLRRHFSAWRGVVGLSDAALADQIRRDGIDIAIDLAGHTAKNSLLALARKPAPIQASWLGYPGTTGLAAMDYYLTDRFFLPPGRFDDQFRENLVHLPASAAFLPADPSPPVNELPALGNGFITFASVNRLSKLNPRVIALWARVLQAVPGAVLLLGAMPQEGGLALLTAWFTDAGIDPARLRFARRGKMADYLALHHGIDLCLDSSPYSGDTTTNHALWMGVPTVTLAGDTPPGREAAAKLAQVGLEDFIAHDADDFVAKAVFWATQPGRLAELRGSLRQRCAAAPLRRPEIVADGLERALRLMWRRWCCGAPAAAFEVSAY
jgi:predicted O-linked N-acetylglucosamine transferase (SPINDLY family)